MTVIDYSSMRLHTNTISTQGLEVTWAICVYGASSTSQEASTKVLQGTYASALDLWTCARWVGEFVLPDLTPATAFLVFRKAAGSWVLTDVAGVKYTSVAAITQATQYGLMTADGGATNLGFATADGDDGKIDISGVWSAGATIRLALRERKDYTIATPGGVNSFQISAGYPRIEYTVAPSAAQMTPGVRRVSNCSRLWICAGLLASFMQGIING
jgi:hypothetical protein